MSAGAAPGGRGTAIAVGCAFLLAALAGGALLVVYVLGGQTQVEGVLLGTCLGGLGLGIVLWAQRLLPDDLTIEARHPPNATLREYPARPAEAAISRRTVLRRMLALGLAGLGAALAIPIFSLGPAPGAEQYRTSWRRGRRLVGTDGIAVTAANVPTEGVLTVFPEGDVGSATAQALLLHVDAARLHLPPGREGWAPEGYLAYSKLCTHAGCPVGLYLAETSSLLCPCHQSRFDVLSGAVPTFGPAARPLPQLPIQLQPDGTFVAMGDFSEPVGPSFWNIHEVGGDG